MTEKYTIEFKQNLVRTYLQEYRENAELSFSSYVRENFPEVIMATAYTWLTLYKNSVGKEQGMSVNEINGVFGKQASGMSLKDKFAVVLETASMDEEHVGEYCRTHGIYKSDLEMWKSECSQALEEPVSRPDIKQQKTEIKELRQKVSKLEKDCAHKDRQIDKKDKALATYAAQVITMKNFQKLFTDSSEED